MLRHLDELDGSRLGHYERFMKVPTSQANNITTEGFTRPYQQGRKGDYREKPFGHPHITDEIKRRIKLLNRQQI
jgi:CTP synthase